MFSHACLHSAIEDPRMTVNGQLDVNAVLSACAMSAGPAAGPGPYVPVFPPGSGVPPVPPMTGGPGTYTPIPITGNSPSTYPPFPIYGNSPSTYTPPQMIGGSPSTWGPRLPSYAHSRYENSRPYATGGSIADELDSPFVTGPAITNMQGTDDANMAYSGGSQMFDQWGHGAATGVYSNTRNAGLNTSNNNQLNQFSQYYNGAGF